MNALALAMQIGRESSGYTRAEITKEYGLNKNEVYNWETRAKTLNGKMVRAWCESYGGDPQVLLDALMEVE